MPRWRSSSRSYRSFFHALSVPRRFLCETLCAQEKRRSEPYHVFRMNLHDIPPCTCITFYPCTCIRACDYVSARVNARARVGQHVGRDSLQRQMLDHLPVAPSRYETRYDYTLSAHRGQGRTVLLDSSFGLDTF